MIYYVAFYASPEDKSRRQNLAGVEKANYIIKTINSLGYEVKILSNAKTLERKSKKVEDIQLSPQGIYLHTFAAWGKGNRFKDIINAAYGLWQLFFYLLLYAGNQDIVCVYHSMGYRGVLAFARKFKKFRYILEVEELFQYFTANQSDYKKKENEVFKEPDAFIFSNGMIEKEINVEKKPSVVVNGVYKNEKKIIRNNSEEIVRLVYAGSLEPQKGIEKILDIAGHLDDKFELRIIGFGSEEDKNNVNKRIIKLKEMGRHIQYDGIKTGTEYTSYLQQCDIGLCIQDDTDIFNRYGFPSKVISYMSNGLSVITNDLIQIKTCEFVNYINVVPSNDSRDIARYINDRKFTMFDSQEALEIANKDFRNNMGELLDGIMRSK